MPKTVMILIRASVFRSVMLAAALSVLAMYPVYSSAATQGADSAQIMREFNQQRVDTERAKSITDKDKHRVMFLMGVVLIALVLTTGGLGIAMAVYGKPVFLAHMIFAGLSITLALSHAVVGIVWFYPF